jgi:hypothetical protein
MLLYQLYSWRFINPDFKEIKYTIMPDSTTTQDQVSRRSSSLLKIICLTGLLAGTLDILAACTDYYIATEKNPVAVLRFIASGVLGKDAFTGGTGAAVFGLALHYLIAFIFTIFFFLVYPKIKLLSKNRIITAIVYGIFIWAIMSRIVLPLSNTPALTFHIGKAIKAALILTVMIGLPLSFIAYNFYIGSKKRC